MNTKENFKFQSALIILAGILANSNDMPLSQPNAYQSNWDLSSKYQQDEIIFPDMIKDGGNKNKYNIDGYELRQQSDADSFAGDSYGSGKYYEKDLTYLLENVNGRELQPSIRSVTGKVSIGNVTQRCFFFGSMARQKLNGFFAFRRISSQFVALYEKREEFAMI